MTQKKIGGYFYCCRCSCNNFPFFHLGFSTQLARAFTRCTPPKTAKDITQSQQDSSTTATLSNITATTPSSSKININAVRTTSAADNANTSITGTETM
jgi:hypothetical protein